MCVRITVDVVNVADFIRLLAYKESRLQCLLALAFFLKTVCPNGQTLAFIFFALCDAGTVA